MVAIIVDLFVCTIILYSGMTNIIVDVQYLLGATRPLFFFLVVVCSIINNSCC
jgi:hypothetical protein